MTYIVDFKIDADLVLWRRSFMTNRKVQLVVDGYKNRERDIKTGILQDSLVFPIFFIIYITRVYEKWTKQCSLVFFVYY